MNDKPSPKLLRLPGVIECTGLPRTTLYRYIKQGTFPAPVALGTRSIAWKSDEVRAWIESRMKRTA